jgi:hypothetical protein
MGSKRGQKGSFIEVFNGFIQKGLLEQPRKSMLKKSYSRPIGIIQNAMFKKAY